MTREVMRSRLPLLPAYDFIRYPVSEVPEEGTIAFVTDGEALQAAAQYKNGIWCRANGTPFKREVRFWTVMERARGE